MPHLRGRFFVDYFDATTLLIGGVPLLALPGDKAYVDGTNGSDTTGTGVVSKPFATIGKAVTEVGAGDSVIVAPKTEAAGDTDPSNYAESVVLPATKPNLRLIGVSHGPAQGAGPQIRVGTGTAANIIVRAPGVLIQGFSINGGGATGGGATGAGFSTGRAIDSTGRS